MTRDTSTAKIWVTWCESQQGKPNNHGKKELFESYHTFKANLQDPAKLMISRHKMHNIVDWSCGARTKEIQVVMDSIHDVEQIAARGAAQTAALKSKRLERKGERP